MARKKTTTAPTATAEPRPQHPTAKERLHDLEEPVKTKFEEVAAPVRQRLEKPVARVSRITKWVKALKPYRVYINFSHADGNLRAAGMGYQSLFAVFAAVWVGFSVAGIWLAGNPDLVKALVTIINRAVPGLIATSDTAGAINPDELTSTTTTFGWTGAIALIGLLWTAIGWLYYTRQAVRAVFGLTRDTTNYVLQKVRDLGLALAFGVVLIFSAILSIISTEALTWLLSVLGLDQDSFWVSLTGRISGLGVSVLLNIFVLGSMFRIMSRVSIPWRNLFFGSLLGSAALSGLSVLGGLLLGGATKNPLLATFAVFIGLLLWFNLVSRVILLSGSWIAVGMFDSGLSPRIITPAQRAAEQAAEEHNARVIVARAELEDAQSELAAARWWNRLTAQRKVERAQNALNDVLDEGVGRPH